jgi:predicted Zn-dependent protease
LAFGFALFYDGGVNELPLTELHCLRAAIGWLELGNPAEARAELAELSRDFQDHPDVLEARFWLASDQKLWAEALDVSRLLLSRAPDRVTGWVHQAYALRRIKDGSIELARDALLPAARQFPKENIVPYNLACYAAQLGQLQEAWDWLHKAMEAAGDIAVIKKRALKDEDLQPLWERIKEL